MELTFATELGQTFSVEIDPQMELENVMALLEAEVGPLSFPQMCGSIKGVWCSPAFQLQNKASLTKGAS